MNTKNEVIMSIKSYNKLEPVKEEREELILRDDPGKFIVHSEIYNDFINLNINISSIEKIMETGFSSVEEE